MPYSRRQDRLNDLSKEKQRQSVRYGTGLRNTVKTGAAIYLPTRKDYDGNPGNGTGIMDSVASLAKFIGDKKVAISAISSAAGAASTTMDVVKKIK